jgi:hypothetical protein
MEQLLKELAGYGFQGILIALLLWNAFYTQKKVFSIIERNTQAFQELKDIIARCQDIHKE